MKHFTFLLMLIKLWPGYWDEQLDQMDNKVDEENGREGTQENGRFRKLWRFSRNKLWKNIGCLISALTFGLGGSRMWDKDQHIIDKK